MWKYNSLTLFILISRIVFSQELFIMTEPASTVPKRALVPKMYTQGYKEQNKLRAMSAVGFYYGITKNAMVRVSATASNHHGKYLPVDMVGHKHVGNQTITTSQTASLGKFYPFIFSGFNLYGQYRFFNKDGDKKHLRMAAYLEYSTAKSAHDEAEPDLMDDNAGWGIGIITTYLKGRKAISLTAGQIFPETYQEVQNGMYRELNYGNAQKFSLSFGYFLSPKEYISYKQPNTNIYIEILGKNIHQLTLIQDNVVISLNSPTHESSFYLEAYPGFQKIFNSATRIDLSVGFPLINSSFVHFAPLYQFSFRHYFFL